MPRVPSNQEVPAQDNAVLSSAHRSPMKYRSFFARWLQRARMLWLRLRRVRRRKRAAGRLPSQPPLLQSNRYILEVWQLEGRKPVAPGVAQILATTVPPVVAALVLPEALGSTEIVTTLPLDNTNTSGGMGSFVAAAAREPEPGQGSPRPAAWEEPAKASEEDQPFESGSADLGSGGSSGAGNWGAAFAAAVADSGASLTGSGSVSDSSGAPFGGPPAVVLASVQPVVVVEALVWSASTSVLVKVVLSLTMPLLCPVTSLPVSMLVLVSMLLSEAVEELV
jgi:hypothetical protein